jgi:hypothetical protein
VEHKAQTHFEGFTLISDLFCARYPAAHMYLEKAIVRHIQIAHFSVQSAFLVGFSSIAPTSTKRW